jgi:diacylglycerol kinase family enzyme
MIKYQGLFRADGFSWQGHFLALAIGNGRQAGGGIPLCPDALIDDGLLDLMILSAMDHAARLGRFRAFAVRRRVRHPRQTDYNAELLDRV